MPMDFPTFDSLKTHAEMIGFREPFNGESEVQFRKALADHVEPIDFIESQEIRNKIGWDKFSDQQNQNMIHRRFGSC